LRADGTEMVTAFLSSARWTIGSNPNSHLGSERAYFRAEYRAFGKSNPAAINRTDSSKYRRGATFNRQRPFADVLPANITESGEVLDLGEL
jgi:hypothetical protein